MVGTTLDRLDGLTPLYTLAEGASVLDLGCSWGYASYALALHGARKFYCIDHNPKDIQAAKTIFASLSPECSSQVVCGDVAEIPEGKWDIILALGIVHHIPPYLRPDFVENIVTRATRAIAIRTPNHSHAPIPAPFSLIHTVPHQTIGELRIYAKNPSLLS